MNKLDFINFLSRYKTQSKEKMTHTIFTNNVVFKVSIPVVDLPLFRNNYIKFISTRGNENEICITEKVQENVQYYIDIDTSSDILNNKQESETDDTFLSRTIEDVLKTCDDNVSEIFGETSETFERITAFRSLYRCHVFYKGLNISKTDAKLLTSNISECLIRKWDWWSASFIDTSVYSSGLRILGCSKIRMEKDNGKDEVKIYRIGKMEDGQLIYNKSIGVDDLESTSIHTYGKIIDPVRPIPTPILPTVPNDITLKRKDNESDFLDDDNDNDNNKKPRIEEYSEEFINKLNCYLDREAELGHIVRPETIKIHNLEDSIRIDLPVQQCPFVDRFHKRSSERNISAHYMLLTAFDAQLRCWKCTGTSKNLNLPDQCIMRVMEDNALNFDLKNSLYKQTHETIAEYIFTVVKNDFATSINKSNYSWYYYNAAAHRWMKGERILSVIMNVKGEIQRRYTQYINSLTMDEESVKKCKDLWKKLMINLQTTQFVKCGILPLLARKLEDYWGNIGIGAMKFDSFASKLDSNPSLMGFNNGVYDFKLHIFRDGKPQDFISMSTYIDYTPWELTCVQDRNELESFLGKIFVDKTHLKYLLQQWANALNGVNKNQNFFILTGAGANGKSTLVQLLNSGLGDYAGEVNVTLFTHHRPPSNAPMPDLIQIKHQRITTCSEPNGKETLNLGTVKWITGGDRITAAAKYGDNESFYLQNTIFMLTNDIPQIVAGQNDFGTWRRMKPVTFNSRFIPKDHHHHLHNKTRDCIFEVDPNLHDKLIRWKEIFISLLIKYQKDMFNGESPTKMPLEFTLLWKQLQDKNDLYSRFIQEYVITSEEEEEELPFVESTEVFDRFMSWVRNLKLSKDVTYDTFEKHMLYLLGKFEVFDGKKGWNVNLKPLPDFRYRTTL